MAVHAISGTTTAGTAVNATLTGWEKYVLVTVTNTSGSVVSKLSITTDGTTATQNGADTASLTIPISGTVTVALKNNFPKPQLSAVTPLATDPSSSVAFTTYGSKVSIITDQICNYTIDLAEDNGTLPIYS